jgi:microcystin-dependent protein
MDVFIGTIVPWPISYAPPYFALCFGQQYTVSQYQAVFSLIGNTYGGNGTVFNLPDLRGRTVVGAGPYMGGLPNYNMGTIGGAATGTVQLGLANLPAHTHGATFTPVVGQQTITLPAVPAAGSLSVNVTGTVNTSATGGASPSGTVYLGGMTGEDGQTGPVAFTGPYAGSSTGGATLGGLSGTVSPSANYSPAIPQAKVAINAITGGSVAVAPTPPAAPVLYNNMQPYLAMNFLFALQGLYPMRP